MNLQVLEGIYSVCQLAPGAVFSMPVGVGGFISITRTRDEQSVVCERQFVPGDCCGRQDNFRVLQVDGPLDFSLIGILSSILSPLAASQISVFTISTYNTDYILIRSTDLDRAIDTLHRTGFRVRVAP